MISKPLTSAFTADPREFAELRRRRGTAARIRLRNRIVCRHLGLARDVLRRIGLPPADREEFFSEACLALIAAVESFRPELGNQFSTYATACIRHRVYRQLQRRAKKSNAVALDEPATMSRDDSPADVFCRQERRTRILGEIEQLPPRERRLLDLRFGLGSDTDPLSFREIAERVSMSKERVRQLVGAALEHLKSRLATVD